MAARLQLPGTLAWQRRQSGDGSCLQPRLARPPSALRSPARDITPGSDGRSLEIAQDGTRRGAMWSVPVYPVDAEPDPTGRRLRRT